MKSERAVAATAHRVHSVLVVDDSAFMRKVVRELIDADARFRVIGVARDGMEALREIHRLDPDIVTMDIEMPVLDGIAALGYVMSEAPRAVVMLSAAAARDGADLTIRALELGAVDFVRKPSGPVSFDVARVRGRLLEALEAAACMNVPAVPMLARPRTARPTPVRQPRAAERVAVIAASTGGPRALAELVPALAPGLGAAVLIVQHMPRGFTASLAARLGTMSDLHVVEGAGGDVVAADRVYVAPGGLHMCVEVIQGIPRLRLDDGPTIWGVRPSADPLFRSASIAFGPSAVGVVLTGMGRDGADGLHHIRQAGGGALVQDEKSSVVSGMPRSAMKEAGADRVVPLDEMAAALTAALAARPARVFA